MVLIVKSHKSPGGGPSVYAPGCITGFPGTASAVPGDLSLPGVLLTLFIMLPYFQPHQANESCLWDCDPEWSDSKDGRMSEAHLLDSGGQAAVLPPRSLNSLVLSLSSDFVSYSLHFQKIPFSLISQDEFCSLLSKNLHTAT